MEGLHERAGAVGDAGLGGGAGVGGQATGGLRDCSVSILVR